MTRRVFLGVLFVLAVAGMAEAQDELALRFYIVPKVGTGSSPMDPFRPKYIYDLGVQASWMDYGREDAFLVGAEVSSAQHTSLASNLDVIAIPQGLDNTISVSALSTVQDKLEGMKVPAGWVTTSHTYRQVVGAVGRFFMLMQRFDGMNARTFFESGITLDTRVNGLTAAQRNALQNAALSLGLDVSFVTPTMTIRAVLKGWIDQMGPFSLAGETF